MATRTTRDLPREYREAEQIRLQSTKKEMILVNGAAILVAIVMAIVGVLLTPVNTFFDTQSPLPSLLRIGVMFVGTMVYLILHEAVHGLFMLFLGKGAKPRFGFKGIYACASSSAYFNRLDYLVVLLSPIVIPGAILLVLNLLVPTAWFWVIYFIQIVNLSGAVGDVYVAIRILGMSDKLLVQESGTAMRFYLPKKKKTKK